MNKNCKCPNQICPNHGNCAVCIQQHHKILHTYCRAGTAERFLRKIYAKLNRQTIKDNKSDCKK